MIPENILIKTNPFGGEKRVTTKTPQFISWFTAVKQKVEQHYAQYPNSDAFLVYKDGKRYIKIINKTTVFAFVDKTNGDLLKASTYNAPAKWSRGNIFDQYNGLKYVTPYGMMSLN